MAVANHLIYLTISIAFTISVGRSLYNNGKPFLMECLGTEKLANTVNSLFLVGFYLMNAGMVFLLLKFGQVGVALEDSLGLLAGRIGLVALIMGFMHINNLFWCDWVRRNRKRVAGQMNLRDN